VYQSATTRLTIVQQRSPVLKVRRAHRQPLTQSERAAFVARLWAWVAEAGFADVLLLARHVLAARTYTAWTRLCASTKSLRTSRRRLI
jgi:hypothetical protein